MRANCPLCDTDHLPFEPCDDSAKRKAIILNEAETDIKNAFGAFAGMVFGGGKFLRDMAAEAEEEDREREKEEEAARRAIPPKRKEVSYSCRTCLDTKQVGVSPYQVSCPVCSANIRRLATYACVTCKDSKRVGAEGAQVDCPACQITVKEVLP